MAQDPVCKMQVGESNIKAEYKDNPYYFCSSNCQAEFKTNPKKYIKR
ncbi:MAG TPA: YHS domain-containing protein [archaeon]|nr:YHS domain-containing protein [archaeon]